jgi:MFS family permease
MVDNPKSQQLKKIPFQLWILGIAEALLNVSAAIIFTISGPFMKEVLKSSSITIGTVEGIVELVSWSARLVSGILSDYFKNRKSLMVLGYLMVILSRPVLALANSIYMVSLGRSFDRIGKGVQASPREALVADISPSDLKGACFGLRHSLGVVGSIVGGVLLFYAMRATKCNYRLIFWISAIPALLAILFLILRVDEIKPPEVKSLKISLKPKELLTLGKGYWTIVIMSIFFMLCRSSEVFIVLRASELGMTLELISFVMMTYNLSEVLISYPIGRLSDYIGRPLCIGIAIVFLSFANFFIGIADKEEIIFLGAFLWGIQRGISHSIFLSWIADKALPYLRGTAYGAFYLISGMTLFFTNLITGIIINYTSYRTLYIGQALLCILPLVGALYFTTKEKLKKHIS